MAVSQASPGEDEAGFGTTSRSLYSGLVRSSRVSGSASFLAANHFLSAFTQTSPRSIGVSEPASSAFSGRADSGSAAEV